MFLTAAFNETLWQILEFTYIEILGARRKLLESIMHPEPEVSTVKWISFETEIILHSSWSCGKSSLKILFHSVF